MQIEMTIDAKRSQIPPLVSPLGTLQGRNLMMDLKPPCPAALGTPPAIPFQDPPPVSTPVEKVTNVGVNPTKWTQRGRWIDLP